MLQLYQVMAMRTDLSLLQILHAINIVEISPAFNPDNIVKTLVYIIVSTEVARR